MKLPALPKSSFLSSQVRDYLIMNNTPPDAIQQQLIEETKQLGDIDIIRIPPEQGTLLTILTQLMNARRTIEIGTFTGYSALCIARGLPSDGQLITCDVNEEWTTIAKKYWLKAGVADRIKLEIGPAIDTLRGLPNDPVFDLSFIDADKAGYIDYYEELIKRTRSGGIILVDNVLWFGLAADPDTDDETATIARAFNDHIAKDDRIDHVMLPIADGLTMARKK